ncbi:acyl carrier protein [Pseudochelatococcus lubricantis]|uniref:Acyl carrier protein n=1 Tax=Pseudochelatococcus lubricantis TaxID=1538102 RepID=A0ABX0UYK9_9HYPH|nr:acyl carrier protein [Pseudochelatococcus lubricantis]NIJ58038.1 acyl carrier protein [Pseudochelatococcus lubricantis]
MQTPDEQIRAFIVENFLFGDTQRDIGTADSFIENDLVDSTGILELVAFVEDTFGITVDDAEIVPANFDSIGKVRDYVLRKNRMAGSAADADAA